MVVGFIIIKVAFKKVFFSNLPLIIKEMSWSKIDFECYFKITIFPFLHDKQNELDEAEPVFVLKVPGHF